MNEIKQADVKDLWTKLLAILAEILSIYQGLLTLSQEKQKILVAAKPVELEKITKQEEELIFRAGKLEEIRVRLIHEIVVMQGLENRKISLKELQELAQPDVASKLAAFNREMNQIMEEMLPLNKNNTELIKQALGFINYNVNVLSQATVGPTYASQGHNETKVEPQRKIFDAKV